MGELIVLEEWKNRKAIEELDELEQALDQYIAYSNLRQQFFIFDDCGNPIEIFLQEGQC